MAYNTLNLETNEGGIAVLKINRPKNLNAINTEVLGELKLAFAALDCDPAVKAVVITGEGEKAFVAGADISEMAGMSPLEAKEFSRKGSEVLGLIGGMNKPVIAAVNGYALGGGLELALACDFIYASGNAKLGLPEVTLGVIPGFGGTWMLAKRIGAARARELVFTGKVIDSGTAAHWGIVNEVFPADSLMKEAVDTAAKMARAGGLAVAAAKDAIANGLENPAYETALFSVLFSTEDQREGMKAFTEKRKPAFRGK
ncbi:MAG: enoyl-CoA hydratase [Elusimicrobia bacterium CG_4_10_14_0_2_um_filter_56_8]|nr:MAG: enoyl-CoA hydratase [Elusimicrobia bacterium CG_4_10_14_0_2_um_filter_56_8]